MFRPLFSTFEVIGLLIVVVQVLRSSEPVSFKVAVVAVPLLALYTVLVLQLGGWLERRRLRKQGAERS
ncbi:MAG TPA: hypothetical protein VFM51_02720 [Solirubrobacterales bacterium]|nr:hypothetical protein [Solirubrobacterales bacterium]